MSVLFCVCVCVCVYGQCGIVNIVLDTSKTCVKWRDESRIYEVVWNVGNEQCMDDA
jgi:hypothetical protein